MKNLTIKKITLISLFIAINIIATIIITIPIGTSGGYINFGDSIIYIVSILFAPIVGGISGGIGAAIVDLIIAPQYAFFSLFIKLIEGLLCGSIYHKLNKKNLFSCFVSLLTGMLWMIGGYFVAEIILMDFSAALLTLIPNLIQGSVSLIVGLIVIEIINKIRMKK